MLFTFCGCSSIEDLIPKEFGKSEGLWLYKSNERMRTDGSEREALFDTIELDGQTVADFSVSTYCYCVDEDKIFFSLKLETGYCLYLFDYMDRSGEALWTQKYDYILCLSDDYMYVRGDDCARLYLHDGTLVSTEVGVDYVCNDGLLCAVDGNELTWLNKDGAHTVELTPEARSVYDYSRWDSFIRDNKLCFIGRRGEGIFVIDLERDALTDIPYEGERSTDRITLDGADYILTCDIARKPHTAGNDGDYYNFRMYELKDGKLNLACAFPKEAVVDIADYGDGYINFRCGRAQTWGEDKNGKTVELTRRIYNWRNYNYCISDGKLNSGLKKIEADKEKDSFVCGEYSFFVTHATRGDLMSVTYCYYLNRRHGDKVETMQYSLQGKDGYNRGHFFDDIRAE